MKVYIVTDLEGVAGVTQWDPRHSGDTPAGALARERFGDWLTEEMNAAARGLFAGGATEVVVNDGHGAGQTMNVELLDPRIKVFHGTERPSYATGLDESFDAVGSVGTHAKAGTEHANLAHTMSTSVRDYSINGVSVGETGLQAYLAGEMGIPYVFCAGDEWAVREMQALCPGCVGASVKYGTSELSALTCTPERSREVIEEAAERAMSVIDEVEPLSPEPPVVLREERHDAAFDIEEQCEDRRVIDSHTMEIEGDSLQEVLNIKYGHDPDWSPIWRES